MKPSNRDSTRSHLPNDPEPWDAGGAMNAICLSGLEQVLQPAASAPSNVRRSTHQQNPHGNRQLFLDDTLSPTSSPSSCPALWTLRTLEDFSQTRQAQASHHRQALQEYPLDFNHSADPTRLQPILDHLRRSPQTPASGNPLTSLTLHRQILAVDGTFSSRPPPRSFDDLAAEAARPGKPDSTASMSTLVLNSSSSRGRRRREA